MIHEVTVEQVILIHQELVRAGPLRDRGLLEGAVRAPFQTVYQTDPYPSIAEKATKLAEGISRAQAFVDGNKRLAWLSTTTFLQINGLLVCAEQVEAAEWVLGLTGRGASFRVGAEWLSDRLDNVS